MQTCAIIIVPYNYFIFFLLGYLLFYKRDKNVSLRNRSLYHIHMYPHTPPPPHVYILPTYTSTHIHMYPHPYTRTHIPPPPHIYILPTYTSTHIHMYPHPYTHTHIPPQIYILPTYTCTHILM